MALPASFGPAEIDRLKQLIDDGVRTSLEIESLKEGLRDTVKSIAEEISIPASLLNKAIKCAVKGDYSKHEEELSDLEKILDAVGQKH